MTKKILQGAALLGAFGIIGGAGAWLANADTSHDQTKINAEGIQILKGIQVNAARLADEKEARRLDRVAYDQEQCAIGNNPKPEQPMFCDRHRHINSE